MQNRIGWLRIDGWLAYSNIFICEPKLFCNPNFYTALYCLHIFIIWFWYVKQKYFICLPAIWIIIFSLVTPNDSSYKLIHYDPKDTYGLVRIYGWWCISVCTSDYLLWPVIYSIVNTALDTPPPIAASVVYCDYNQCQCQPWWIE